MPLHFKLSLHDSVEAHEWAETIRILQPIVEGAGGDLPSGMTQAKAQAAYDDAKANLKRYFDGEA